MLKSHPVTEDLHLNQGKQLRASVFKLKLHFLGDSLIGVRWTKEMWPVLWKLTQLKKITLGKLNEFQFGIQAITAYISLYYLL